MCFSTHLSILLLVLNFMYYHLFPKINLVMFIRDTNTIIFLFITSTCQYLIFYFYTIMWIFLTFSNIPSMFTPILTIKSFIITAMSTYFVLWFAWIVSWFIYPFFNSPLKHIVCYIISTI